MLNKEGTDIARYGLGGKEVYASDYRKEKSKIRLVTKEGEIL